MPAFVDVALRAPADRLLTYEVPPSLAAAALRGARVVVPVQRTLQTGVVVAPAAAAPEEPARALVDVLDERPLFTPALLELAEWLARYYHCGVGEALFAMLPSGLKSHIDTVYRHAPDRFGALRDVHERQLCYYVAEHPGITRRELLAAFPAGSTPRRLEKLVAGGILQSHRQYRPHQLSERMETAVQWTASLPEPADLPVSEFLRQQAGPVPSRELERRFPGSARQILSLARRGRVTRLRLPAPYAPNLPGHAAHAEIQLSPEQLRAVEAITGSLGRHRTFLLYGVTGSGKTEVYIRCLAWTLSQGKSALYLVPEIGLADHLLGRLAPHFESQLALLHSGLSERERARAWKAVAQGERRLLVGTRSACLAPLANLGLVIADEEQDPSFKQEKPAPRYHGRDVAIWRAKASSAVCVLGSATPSLESWHHACTGKYELLRLPERVGGGTLPTLQFCDRRVSSSALPGGLLTGVLAKKIESVLQNGEQCILFLNRRGYSGSLRCGACGGVPRCPDCSIAFAYHRDRRQLRCHHCGRAEPAPRVCGACGGSEFTYPKAGTQQVERELAALFPRARVARLDLDAAATAGGAKKVLSAFGGGEVDILLGTQMVTKGLHFPRVSLVGILNADQLLDLPDFRASERAVQQLMQAAGRSGRGQLPGSVYAQTFNPDATVFAHLKEHDFEAFARTELAIRSRQGYPPYTRCIAVWVGAEAEEKAEEACRLLARHLNTSKPGAFRLLGPAPAPILRVRRQYRWHIILLTRRIRATLEAVEHACLQVGRGRARLCVDVDPVHLL
jgi:primosomal protein N' (replication factor Y)